MPIRKRRLKLPRPPWINDSHPERWLTVSQAAQFWFRKKPITIKRMIKDGTLAENDIPSYWDGWQWWVRLPITLDLSDLSDPKSA